MSETFTHCFYSVRYAVPTFILFPYFLTRLLLLLPKQGMRGNKMSGRTCDETGGDNLSAQILVNEAECLNLLTVFDHV